MQDERRKRQVVQVLAKPIVQCLEEERILFDHIKEIKLRIGKPLIIIYRGKERCDSHKRGDKGDIRVHQ